MTVKTNTNANQLIVDVEQFENRIKQFSAGETNEHRIIDLNENKEPVKTTALIDGMNNTETVLQVIQDGIQFETKVYPDGQIKVFLNESQIGFVTASGLTII